MTSLGSQDAWNASQQLSINGICSADETTIGRNKLEMRCRIKSSHETRIVARSSPVTAFTLIEVMFAMAIIGVLVVALYAAIATSTSWLRLCQENETVTQIMSEKLDTIRLYNWDQVNSNGFILTNFTVGIAPLLPNSTPYYTGTVSIVQNPVSETYRSDLLQVTVSITWQSGFLRQNRNMSTFIAKYGLQTFISY